MAYNDSGAFVLCAGQRREDREDVAVFGDDGGDVPSGLRIFANLSHAMARRQGTGDAPDPWWAHTHHAVLGDGPTRLCGYKSHPELWHRDDDGTVTAVDLLPYRVTPTRTDRPIYEPGEYAGVYAGARFRVLTYDNRRGHGRVALELVEADGTRWFGLCGYLYGAGHMTHLPELVKIPTGWVGDPLIGDTDAHTGADEPQ